MPDGETETPEHRRFLVVSAHPDDPEFAFGGTIAGLTAAGREVAYVICTDGSQGGEDPSIPDLDLVAVREREQRAAAAILGVTDVTFLGWRDGYLAPSPELRRDITRQIRIHRPDVVITHRPDRVLSTSIGASHPDHQAVGEATFAAVYPDARNPRAYRELLAEGLEPHKVRQIWILSLTEQDHFVDITPSIETKIAAIRCHASQLSKPGQDPADIEKWIRERAATVGKMAGLDYAERLYKIDT